MPLSTPDAVEAALLRDLTAAESGLFSELAAAADAVIAEELPDVVFGSSGSETATLRGPGTNLLWTPKRPVAAVTAAAINGSAVDLDEVQRTDWGPLERILGWWGDRTDVVSVTYDFGVSPPPRRIIDVAAELVANRIQNPTGLRQESIDGYSATYGAMSTSGLSASSLRTLARYRKPVTSVSMTPGLPG